MACRVAGSVPASPLLPSPAPHHLPRICTVFLPFLAVWPLSKCRLLAITADPACKEEGLLAWMLGCSRMKRAPCEAKLAERPSGDVDGDDNVAPRPMGCPPVAAGPPAIHHAQISTANQGWQWPRLQWLTFSLSTNTTPSSSQDTCCNNNSMLLFRLFATAGSIVDTQKLTCLYAGPNESARCCWPSSPAGQAGSPAHPSRLHSMGSTAHRA